MKLRHLLLSLAIAATLAACKDKDETPTTDTTAAAPAAPAPAKLPYPEAKVVEQTDEYHGTKIADPYRWMENLEAPELKSWIDAQNKVTQDYLADAPGKA